MHERGLSRAEVRAAASPRLPALEIIFAITLLGGLALALATIRLHLIRLSGSCEPAAGGKPRARSRIEGTLGRLVRAQETNAGTLAGVARRAGPVSLRHPHGG